MTNTNSLVVGLVVGLVGGGVAAGLFRWIVVWIFQLGTKPFPNLRRIPGWLTGFVERAAFMAAVWIGVPDVATAMMAWLGLKLAANWGRYDSDARPKSNTWAMLALLCGIISMSLAYTGAMMIQGATART